MLSSSISSSNNDDDDDIKEAKDTDESEYYMVKWEQELRHPPLEGKCILGYDYENKKFHLCQYRQGQRRTIKILYEDNNFFRSDVKKIYEPLLYEPKGAPIDIYDGRIVEFMAFNPQKHEINKIKIENEKEVPKDAHEKVYNYKNKRNFNVPIFAIKVTESSSSSPVVVSMYTYALDLLSHLKIDKEMTGVVKRLRLQYNDKLYQEDDYYNYKEDFENAKDDSLIKTHDKISQKNAKKNIISETINKIIPSRKPR